LVEIKKLLLSSSDDIDTRITMTEDFDIEKYTQEMADLKVDLKEATDKLTKADAEKSDLEGKVSELEASITDLEAKLETANELISNYKAEEEARLEAEMNDKIEEINKLRKERSLPEKDYKGASMAVLDSDLDLLRSLPSKAKGKAKEDDLTEDEKKAELKEFWTKKIFG
jgi:predicted RNase H-like nuclease (RuvC/YqgF family)